MTGLRTLLAALLAVSTVLSSPLTSLSKREGALRQEFTNKNGIASAYRNAHRRVIMLDYDGTLVPFVNDPEKAVPTKKLLDDLRTLAGSPKNTVWLISGRDKKFLKKHFDKIKGLGLSAEHGAFVKNPGKDWKSLGQQFDIKPWIDGSTKIMQKWADKTPGCRVEKKEYSLSWHYREAKNPQAGKAAATKLGEELNLARQTNSWDMVVLQGQMVVEVKSLHMDKGQIVRDILYRSWAGQLHAERAGKQTKVDFVFNAGDDTSDEHMFKAVAKADRNLLNPAGVFTMWVKHDNKPDKETTAKWRISQPKDKNMAWNAPPELLGMFATIEKGK